MRRMTIRIVVVCAALSIASAALARAQDRAASTIMETLAPSRNVEVTDAQLEELKTLQMEALWDALGAYRENYVRGFQTTQPGERVVGRALTMRHLPPRPDLVDALNTLAGEGDWNRSFYGRAADEATPGDVIVVELGGMSGDHMFGDMGALGMKLAGIRGAVVDGGGRDLAELSDPSFAGFPVFARYFTAVVSQWQGVDWNVPVRIGRTTVLPGDIVVASDSGVLFIPPQLIGEVLDRARAKVAMENYQRELLRSGEHRFGDIYPLSPALLEEYERRSRPRR
ncbi:MAG: hypothetical protein CL476_08995 [Acidobacteria bacterium]|mgnify:FL=1|nr:hypothetical protein [Acidobacteriota bacterium]